MNPLIPYPSIDSPPVAQKSRDRKPPAAADETAMCLISGAANHVDAEVRAQRFLAQPAYPVLNLPTTIFKKSK